MTIELRLFGEFRDHLPEGSTGGRAEIELPEGATVYTLVERLGLPYEAEEGVLVAAVNVPSPRPFQNVFPLPK